ncbi:unnamed protein product [Mytilus coruscus]|uniref:Phorbol-ester/DAG-type domain-containing protein n=1 Tax=Mytilus coruscus TaxID=42192 RepID=A0A6J8DI56_MYTCO|nr:unnamed protein product [Mytilus coruscus]
MASNFEIQVVRRKEDATIHRIVEIIKDYSLNVDKALIKKPEATQRSTILEYKQTSGGLVIKADAATFELLKHATVAYFEELPCNVGEATIQREADRSKKKCRTRSTYCSSGQHWVHYICQRLSIKEIETIEEEELEDYTCRIFEEANLKILEKVLSPAKKCTNSITSYHHNDVPAITLEINTNRNDDSTEKSPETCAVCDTIITDDKYEICDICSDIAHPECMAISGNSFTCHSCSNTIKRLEPLQDENEQNESSQTLIKSCELPEDKENSQEQTHEKSLVRINNPERQDPHNGPEIANNKGKKNKSEKWEKSNAKGKP